MAAVDFLVQIAQATSFHSRRIGPCNVRLGQCLADRLLQSGQRGILDKPSHTAGAIAIYEDATGTRGQCGQIRAVGIEHRKFGNAGRVAFHFGNE